MKILMLHPHDLSSPLEPWTIRIKNIAHEFTKKGCAVKLVYFPLDKKYANKSFLDDSVEIITLDRRFGIFILLQNIVRIIKLARWCDIIHFQKWHYHAALPALVAAWISNKPVHYDWDDWETKIFYYSNPKQIIVGSFINIFEKLIPKVVDTVSVTSERLRDLCLSRGVSRENIFSAPVGANLQQFRPDPKFMGAIKRKYNINSDLILYAGQLHGGQYVELFIKAACIITKSRANVTFMVVGDGYRRGELMRLAAHLGISKRFIFTGSVAHDKIPYYINDADVCVACFEDTEIARCKSPLKIVEYLACAKAIVASNVGEIRNMVGGVGVLTEPGEVDSLAKGAIVLLGDDELRKRLEGVTRERVTSKYNWSITAGNLLQAYKKSLKPRDNKLKGGGIMEKTEEYKILTAEVISVSEHKGAPHTIEIMSHTSPLGEWDALTIDPRCSFYKHDKHPKSIDIVKAGNIIEVTYMMHEGRKIALNIIVKPEGKFM